MGIIIGIIAALIIFEAGHNMVQDIKIDGWDLFIAVLITAFGIAAFCLPGIPTHVSVIATVVFAWIAGVLNMLSSLNRS